jgi:hypothetical protein
MVDAILHLLAVIEGESPLSSESVVTQLLRALIPLNTAVLYWMVRQLKSNANGSSLRNEIREVKQEVEDLRVEHKKGNIQ